MFEDDRVKTLMRLVTHLPKPLRELAFQEALAAAVAIQDELDRAKALTGLAPHLPESLLQEALEVARTIKREYHRLEALTTLVPHLAEPLKKCTLREMLVTAQSVKSKELKTYMLMKLVPYLSESLKESALPALLFLWQELLETWSRCPRKDLLSDLRALTPVVAKLGGDEAIIELFHAIQDVGRWWP